ncbi:MAG: Tc toxin subunit A [Lyngbya sp.]|nr:Tc toxin subunit A [Lyngbya sp.]
MARIYIELTQIEAIVNVLGVLGELFNQDSQLQEQIVRDGLIFKKISNSEFKVIQQEFKKLEFSNYTFANAKLTLLPPNKNVQELIKLLFVLIRQNNQISKILLNKIICIDNLDPDKAREIQKYLNSKGIKAAIEEDEPQSYLVRGTVIQSNNISLPNLIVRAFDWDSQGEELLGETITDANGNYQITYTNEKFSRFETEGSGPDLIVRAYNQQGEILSSSPRKNNAQVQETVDLTISIAQEDIFVVQGTIRQDYGNFALSNVRVVAVDKCVGEEQILGEAITDTNGNYTINYSLMVLTIKGKEISDLQIKVMSLEDRNDILAISPIKYDASKQEVIDVIVPTEKLKRPDEYQRISNDLSPHCKNQSNNGKRFAQLQENDERQDITYLANKTGWDARMVAMVALADQFSQKSEIQSEFYYALFRAGIPANEKVLSQIQPEIVQDLWNKAADEKIIPDILKGEISQNVERFKSYAAGQLLNQSATIGVSSLKELLDVSLGTDENRKQRFAQLYYDNKNNSDSLWQKVSEEFGQETSDRLQLDGKLSFLTINNSKLIGKLHQNRNLRNPIDLVRSGLYKRDNWNEFLSDDIAVPPEIPGQDETEKKANYADFMVNQLKLSYPTTLVAEMLNNNEISLPADNAVKANVYQFFTEQQEQFELGIHPVEDYLQKRNLNLAEETLTQVKRLQRVYQISPSDEAMNKLLEGNIDSAYAVIQYDEREFVQQFKGSLGGEETAKLAYAKAHQVHHSVLNVVSAYLLDRLTPQLYALPLAQKTPEDTGVIAYPTLEELFGEMDYCACEHCRSVLSPAAYLVDLLQFIDRQTNAKENPLDVLLNRRPDIQHLQLTCENTNTVLPYIDLVNEILEHFVVNGVENGNFSLQNFQGFNIEGEITTEELLANPQFVNATAYEQLKQEIFPLLLPFHQPLEALRRYFNRFEVPLHLAMQQLRRNDNLDKSDQTNPTDYAWRDILIERLQLSRREYAVLTDSTISLQQLYGEDPNIINEPNLVDQLSSVKNFAQKVGISYEELLELVQTQIINPHSHLIPKIEKLGVDFLTLKSFVEGTIPETDFEALLADDLSLNQYGGDVKKWVRDNYEFIIKLILLSDPTNSQDNCNFERLEFRYGLPDFNNNKLQVSELLKLIRFVRLWKKLGWSIEHTDKAIAALYPANQYPSPDDDQATVKNKLDQGFREFILNLAHLTQVLETLGLSPKKELVKLLAFWSTIDTHGNHSLYHQMFLNSTILQLDDVFEEDGYGNYPKSNTEKIIAHKEALQSAFNLTYEELNLILNKLNFDEQTNITLENLSAIFRHAYLAKKLKLSVWEFLSLQTMSGINPFQPMQPIQPAILTFISLAQQIQRSPFKISQLSYFLQHEDLSGKASPTLADIHAFAQTIREDITEINQEHTVEEDPTGEVTRNKMTLVYGNAVTDTFFGLLNSSSLYSVTYNHSQPQL